MIERKIFAGAYLDSDTEDRLLEPNAFRGILNVRTGIAEDNDGGAATNMKGTTLVPYDDFPTGKVIGAYEDEKQQRVIYFLYNSQGRHQILEYDIKTNLISVILETALLNFQEDYPILHIDIIDDDLLFWTDNYNEPRQINITRAKNTTANTGTDQYPSPFTEQYINAIKYPPLFPPTIEYSSDATKNANRLKKILFQFKYRNIYPDGEKSAWSPISKLTQPTLETFDFITKFEPNSPADGTSDIIFYHLPYWDNTIKITIKTGDAFVSKIEIAGRESKSDNGLEVDGDFFSIIVLDKTESNITSNTDYVYSFYNDKVYSSIDINESNKLFDNVPRKALTQAFTENKLFYFNILDGYNQLEGNSFNVTLEALYNNLPTGYGNLGTYYTDTVAPFIVESVPVWQTLYIIEVTGNFPTLTFYYISKENETTQEHIQNMADTINNDTSNTYVVATNLGTPFPDNFEIISTGSYTISKVTLKIASSFAAIRSFKSGAFHEVGLIYYDFSNRNGAVIDSSETIYIPYRDTLTQKGKIGLKTSISHTPPSWATHYQLAYTKNQTVSKFLQVYASGSSVGQVHTIDITSLARYGTENPNSILSYGWSKGDRIRYEDIDLEILNYDSGTGKLTTDMPPTLSNVNGIAEIYTPRPTNDTNLFYEFGEVYEILDAGTSTRRHRGSTQDQDSNYTTPAIIETYDGDTYLKQRMLSQTSGGSAFSYIIEENNYSDFYESAHTSRGRVNIKDENYKETRREATAFVSETYIPDTNINGLCSFYGYSYPDLPERAKDYDQSKGSVQKIFAKEKSLTCYQELNVGKILVSESVVYDQSGVPQIQKSNEILSDMIYYKGEYGIGTSPGSHAVYGFREYFADPNRGAVLRLSNDGITPISEYNMHNYFTDTFKDISLATPVLVGVYDVKFGKYILSIAKKSTTTEEVTGTFREEVSGVSSIGATSANFITGQPVTICYYDRRISQNVCHTVTITNIKAGYVYIDTLELQLNNSLNEGDSVTIKIESSTIVFSETLSFDERENKWKSKYSYQPEMMVGAGIGVLLFKDGKLYKANDSTTYNNFFGTQYSSEIELIANKEPLARKIFLALSENTSDIWEVTQATNQNGQLTNLIASDFEKIENEYYAEFLKDENSNGGLIEGEDIRGNELKIKIKNSDTDLVKLFNINIISELSERTNK